MDIQDPFSLIFRIESVTKDLCKYSKGYLVDAILIKEIKTFILDLRPFEYRKMTRHQNGPMSSWQWFYHSVGVTAHVRYINILTLHGSGAFVTNFYFGVVFYILKSPLAMRLKRNFTNLQLPPKNPRSYVRLLTDVSNVAYLYGRICYLSIGEPHSFCKLTPCTVHQREVYISTWFKIKNNSQPTRHTFNRVHFDFTGNVPEPCPVKITNIPKAYWAVRVSASCMVSSN